MEIVLDFLDGSEGMIIKSKSVLTPEKVYDLLLEESAIVIDFQTFLKEVWVYLTEGIAVYKPKILNCTLNPFLVESK